MGLLQNHTADEWQDVLQTVSCAQNSGMLALGVLAIIQLSNTMFSSWLNALSKLVNVITDTGNGQVLLYTTISSTWSHSVCALHDGTYRLTVPYRRPSTTGFQRCLPSPWAVEVVQESKGDLFPSTSLMASCPGLLLIMATLSIYSFQMRRGLVLATKQCSFPFN